nr:hypothetical protein [uncultured Carboxylicivirga sp.]
MSSNLIVPVEVFIRWMLFRILNKVFKTLRLKCEVTKFGTFEKKLQRLLLELNASRAFVDYVRQKKDGLNENSQHIKTLVLRGSTADYSFFSPVIENSYNLGLTSTDLHTCYYLYVNNKDKLVDLDTIVLFFGVFVPGYSLQLTSEKWRAVVYRYYFDIPYVNSELEGSRYEKYILSKCKKNKNTELKYEDGYVYPIFFHAYSAERRIKGHLRENKRQPSQLLWLNKLSDELGKDGRKFVIVFPPYRSDYKKLLPNFEELYSEVLLMKNIHFIDFTNSDFLDDSDFGDTEHLKPEGAQKLTVRLKQQLEEFHLND